MAFIYVGVGGFLGSCLRYVLAVFFRNLGVAFPLGTLVSNVIAGLLIGFIIGMERQTGLISPQIKLFLNTGLLGGLSTFSTFSLETVELFSSQRYANGVLNAFLNISLSLCGVVLGMIVAKSIFRKG